MSATVTITQHFPRRGRERIHDEGARPRRVKPRRMTRGQIRRLIAEALAEIDSAGAFCGFEFCPGPDAPTRAMLTCRACYGIKRLRVLLGWLEDP